MKETVLVFDDHGKTICFFEPEGRTSGSIPDTRSLWDILWDNRDRLGGVAHTHPWDGPASPSGTDRTTFEAIERGLGKHLLWPVVTFTDVLVVIRNPLYREGETATWTKAGPLTIEIEGIEELRARSR
jgi:hypothetical protein